MKKALIFLSAAVLTFLLASCSGCETKECWDSKAAFEKQQSETRAQNAATLRAFEIEKMKAQAAIEAAKPESVRLQETKNAETTTGEGISTASKVIGGVYIGAKIIDALSK